MNRPWIALLVGACTAPAAAQMSVAPFRANDPFLFCTQGYEVSVVMECWVPLPPFTSGLWAPTGICYPNPYGRSWTQRDYQALALYETVCPMALKPGAWVGPGTGAQTPFVH